MNDSPARDDQSVPLTHFLGPRYWPVWLGVGLMRLIAALPYRLQVACGKVIGALAGRVAGRRKRVAQRNIERCFPELGPAERADLLRRHFASVGIGLVEIAIGWWGTPARLTRLGTIKGLDHLHSALATGKGVILLAGHFTTIEIGATILSISTPFHAMYRRFENPLFEQIMRRRRLTRVDTVIRRGDMRQMMRSLKTNNAVLYMPDQAYVRSNSVQVPFFGHPAPTSTGTSRMAQRTDALVVPFLPLRRSDGRGYDLEIFPALENYPGGDPEADTARINQIFEEQVRKAPEQYLWIHRRFKGVDGFY